MNDRPRATGSRRSRQGVIVIVVLVCVVVALAMFAAIARQAAAARNLGQKHAREAQADWLAESALERAAWRLAADADYTGETWTVSAELLGGSDSAVVAIEVKPIPEQPNRRTVHVRADYPDDPQYRVRRTKQTEVELILGTSIDE